MGQLAKKVCAKVSCNVLTSQRFCPDHERQGSQSSQQYDKHRSENPIRQMYFTESWRATRRVITARDPICKLCLIFASSIADHVIPAKEYLLTMDLESDEALRRFCDESNLQGVCKACHNSKTATETNKFRSQ